MELVEYEKIKYIKKPLAEISGEIAGALFNPEGFKEYKRAKEREEKESKTKKKKTPISMGSKGGTAASTVTVKNGTVIDSTTGKPLMSLDALQKYLSNINL